jgi:hypothetical protein
MEISAVLPVIHGGKLLLAVPTHAKLLQARVVTIPCALGWISSLEQLQSLSSLQLEIRIKQL